MAHVTYSVDRLGQLQAGMSLELIRYANVQPPVLQVDVDAWFPEGVTSHGERYLLRPAPAFMFEPNIELTCELIRRAEFPNLPSRFQSAFGCKSLAEAKLFLAEFGPACRGAQIFEVETDVEPFRADMRCLNIQGSILVAAYGARRYWRQDPNKMELFPGVLPTAPFWELLLQPPVRVLRQVA
jgi:hypothetical protein